MARFPRRGKGSDKTTDEGKINNSVSARDGKSGHADEAYIPAAPKPPQPPKAGRTDLNAAQGFQRQQQMYSSTTPKMSRRQQAKVDAMKSPAPQSPSAAPGMGMGGSSSSTPEFEQREFVPLTRQDIDKLAMNSVRDEYAGRKAADLTHIHKDDFRAIEDAVPFAQDRFDRWQAEWQGMAQEFALSDMTRMTAEGEQGSKITSHDMTYHKDGNWLVGIHASGDPEKETWHDFTGVFDAVAEKPESKEEMNATFTSGGSRHAVFFGKGDGRIQFSDSLPWRVEAVKDLEEFRGVLAANDEKAVGDRLYVSALTPYERALEQVEQREPQEGERHERVFKEITGREYSSLSNPAVERPFEVTATDMKVIDNGFDQAPALAGQVADEPVRDALPREGRATTAEGIKEQYQWHANKMFGEGRDLKDIREETGVKPEGADKTAWEKTEYVYGQPTALDRLQELGTGAFAASESGYTYAMSADGKELLRFDGEGNPAGAKPVEDVQAYLHQQRSVEFDQQQKAKEMHAAELAEQKAEDQVVEQKIAVYKTEEPAEVVKAMDELEDEKILGIDEDRQPIYEQEPTAENVDAAEAISSEMPQPEVNAAVLPELSNELSLQEPSTNGQQEQTAFVGKEPTMEVRVADTKETTVIKSEVSTEIEDDLVAEFDAGRADYIAKYPDQEIGNELSTEKVVEDDIVVEFDRGNAHYEANHPEMAEGKVREVSATEPSQKASDEPEEDLVAEFENAKELKDAKEAEAPEQAVEQEEEEDYRLAVGMSL